MAGLDDRKLITVLLAMLPLGNAIAQGDASPALYVSVECMKATSPAYERIELETWQPMHQHLVDTGKRNSWALYRVLYGDRSRCDYYTVTTFLGNEQLNDATDLGEVFNAVHPRKDFDEAMAQTWSARRKEAAELWMQVDRTELKPYRYAVVNRMLAEDPVAYETMESQVFKAGHQALIDGGHRAGWAVYTVLSPLGSAVPYNYGTVDFVNRLGPVPMADAMLAANPDRDLEAMVALLELREHVLSETWVLVTRTKDPAGN